MISSLLFVESYDVLMYPKWFYICYEIQVIKHLKYSNVAVPPLYEEFFRKALLTFQHQRVYDPIKEDIVYLSDISDSDGDDTDFLGPYPWKTISCKPKSWIKHVFIGHLIIHIIFGDNKSIFYVMELFLNPVHIDIPPYSQGHCNRWSWSFY